MCLLSACFQQKKHVYDNGTTCVIAQNGPISLTNFPLMNFSDMTRICNHQFKLEQLECLHSEDTLHRLMIAYNID